MAELPSVARALLETIAGPESAGDYNVIYGGSRFSDYADHPRQYIEITSGPNKGKKSSAAGKYQFIGSTWDDQASKLGLTDFSPASQDAAAWNLAQEQYRRDTGRNLLSDLQAGDLSRVPSSLRSQWTSLPGGIEQGIGPGQFASAYQRALGAGAPPIMAYAPQPRNNPAAAAAANAASGQQGRGFFGNLVANVRGALPQIGMPEISPQFKNQAIGALMGSLAGRTAVIDPFIQGIFTGGGRTSTPEQRATYLAQAQNSVSQSGDTSVGNQLEAAQARASGETWRSRNA